ncbi:hypothetical protein [Deinococcus roseus]|nr:hypothetical protein [Deinococcus roseus]
MTLQWFKNQVQVLGLSNLSTRFCPEPACLQVGLTLLENLKLDLTGCTVYAFDFRLCPECQTINVVKNQEFYCSVCDAALPLHWNFEHPQ